MDQFLSLSRWRERFDSARERHIFQWFSSNSAIDVSGIALRAMSVVLHESISAQQNQGSERLLFDCATGQPFSSIRGT
jgi:hypothetical protein